MEMSFLSLYNKISSTFIASAFACLRSGNGHLILSWSALRLAVMLSALLFTGLNSIFRQVDGCMISSFLLAVR